MKTLIAFMLNHRRSVLALWVICLLAAVPLSLRLPSVIQGSSEAIRGSESEYVTHTIQHEFGKGSAYSAVVVVQSAQVSVQDAGFAAAIRELEGFLTTTGEVRSVTHAWNSSAGELVGGDGKSALLLVQPRADSLAEAESFTATLRKQLGGAPLREGFSAKVTGPAAMFYDINRNSSADLLRAEMVGVPLTLFILLAVFGAPLAAALALVLAFAAVTLSAAVLYLLSPWLPVTVFAQNAITIIGLGAGVDYCLFVLYRYRVALKQGMTAFEALLSAWKGAGPAVIVAGLAVGVGFLALFLVNARILHSLAIGGLLVTFGAVAAAVTLLPVLLHLLGNRINWYADAARESAVSRVLQKWGERLAHRVMERPWLYLVPSLVLVAGLAAPALRMNSWSIGVTDLPPEFEAREGYELLDRQFEKGWMGPVVLLLESSLEGDLWQEKSRQAVLATASRLRRDERVAQVHGFSRALEALGGAVDVPHAVSPRPDAVLNDVINANGTVAVLNVIPRYPPESPEMMAFVRELRAHGWTEAEYAGITVKVGGTSALIHDFDTEMFDSLWRVVPAVLAVSFVALLFFFRSILIPLKAVAVNLLSVFAAYGFLVFVFQDGISPGVVAVGSTGGLNSFVVLMLFTILFGLSMDYEVVLLRQIQEHYRRTGDNATAVASGLGLSAGVITSAAAIMVCLFGSLLFTQLVATRQFGLGMAFAVALDASLIRLLIIPATMVLLGHANWWYPGGTRSKKPQSLAPVPCGCKNSQAGGRLEIIDPE
jgi:RND superfamily putative drug exporter